MIPSLLIVIGASGAGKTAAVGALAARRIAGVRCYHFDSIGVPSTDEMERTWGSGEAWQKEMTKQWIERLAQNGDSVECAVLEGQTRPSFIDPELASAGIRHARIVLLDCTPATRLARLAGPRAQPELANERMSAWAAYLRGQVDALGAGVVDTSEIPVERVADYLQGEVEALRSARGAAA